MSFFANTEAEQPGEKRKLANISDDALNSNQQAVPVKYLAGRSTALTVASTTLVTRLAAAAAVTASNLIPPRTNPDNLAQPLTFRFESCGPSQPALPFYPAQIAHLFPHACTSVRASY